MCMQNFLGILNEQIECELRLRMAVQNQQTKTKILHVNKRLHRITNLWFYHNIKVKCKYDTKIKQIRCSYKFAKTRIKYVKKNIVLYCDHLCDVILSSSY